MSKKKKPEPALVPIDDKIMELRLASGQRVTLRRSSVCAVEERGDTVVLWIRSPGGWITIKGDYDQVRSTFDFFPGGAS